MIKPPECSSCPLGRRIPTKDGFITLGKGFTATEGKAKFGVYLVGESAGRNEEQEGLPFRRNGESGSLITHIIEHQLKVVDPETSQTRKMERADFSWDNILKCRPPNDELVGKTYEDDAIENCRIYNVRSFGGISNAGADRGYQKVILALGGTAFRELTGVSGHKKGIEDIRGYVFRSNNFGALVIGALHPSFIRHGNARRTGSLIYDIKKALLVANGSYTSYSEHPSFQHPVFVREGKLEALVSLYYKLKANRGLPIYYDIENEYTRKEEEEDKGDEEEESGKDNTYNITSIQFAYDRHWAITVPWEKPFIKVAIAILALENDKIGANVWLHDNPRLEFNGAKINGVIHDLMWAWHHLQPGLWKGLQRIGSFFDVPINWKHLGIQEGQEDEYGCWDVIAPAYIWDSLPTKMRRVGVWDSYLKFKMHYRVILKKTEERGLFVDKKEHTELTEWVTKAVKVENDNLQEGVPLELRNLEPVRKDKETGVKHYGYVREPAIVKELRSGYNQTRQAMLNRGVQANGIKSFEQWAEHKTGLSYRGFTTVTRNGKGLYDLDGPTEFRWCRVNPFKASSQQLIKYLKFKGYKVPRTLKENRETTGKKELQELWEATNDPLLGSVIRQRSYSKMLSNDIPNWMPDKDGVVRTTFKFDPPNLQLNSSSPNIQNASKHPKEWELIGKTASELTLIGQRFRRIVKAPPGRCVVEFDKTAFHVSMMGFEARDPLYIKWAPYMHTAFASYVVGEPISLDGEIDKDKLNWIKKKFKVIRDGQAKPTVLGNQLGLGHVKLHYMNRTFIDESGVRQIGIADRKRAKYLQDMLAALFPKIEVYKKRIKEEAHFKGNLLNNFGVIRWFFDVLRWDYKTRQFRNASEAEEAVSHPVQSDAFGMIHEEIIDMADTSEMLEEHHFANTIHDSLVMFPEIGKRDKCIEQGLAYLRKPCSSLIDSVCCPDGLVVDVEVMASPEGGNWSAYHRDRNPLGIQEVKV